MTFSRLALVAFTACLLGFSTASEARRGDAQTFHVDVDCLSSTQKARLERGFDSARGAIAFDDISSRCVVEMAPEGAGVSPFLEPCRGGRLAECSVSAVFTLGPDDTEFLSLINPDSMHPECLVGANPTPHP